MVGITWPHKLNLTPLVLHQLGRPKYVTFVSPTGGRALTCNRDTEAQTNLWFKKSKYQSGSMAPIMQKNIAIIKTYA
ncbi:hypothetical protein IFR05_008807 [Cadophora sp. M221]|nr:hypothetical protein IFR05_008807 [Cadophora sp. M221]